MQNVLLTPIEFLKGVGSNRGDLLHKELGIYKYVDLVNFFQTGTLTAHGIIRLMNCKIIVSKFRLFVKSSITAL